MNTRDTLKINAAGHLEIGGADCTELAKEFQTPLYVFDEAYIRKMMALYRDTINEEYDGHGLVLYASKAFSCKAMYEIAKQEGIGVDVVSGGELYTALSVGFPAEKIYLHGNNKLPYERREALDAKIGGIVVDAYTERTRSIWKRRSAGWGRTSSSASIPGWRRIRTPLCRRRPPILSSVFPPPTARRSR